MSLDALAWPSERAPQALAALARAAGLEARPVELPPTPPWLAGADGEARRRWLSASAEWLGVELEDVDAPYPEVDAMLRGAAPALLELPGGKGLLVVLGRRGGWLRLMGQELAEARRPLP
ncbi:MAG TPA: hypothetical protein VK447_10675, partial [Myxococcaceae bacterium]|nr:hypothetical protein [Myxococcaceae bacterium]